MLSKKKKKQTNKQTGKKVNNLQDMSGKISPGKKFPGKKTPRKLPPPENYPSEICLEESNLFQRCI